VGDAYDVWLWTPEEGGVFPCALLIGCWRTYYYLTKLWVHVKNWVFGKVWKRPASSKVVVFSWSLLLDRIPTLSNLAFRHALDPGASWLCVIYWDREETTRHLFLHCEATSKVWRMIINWFEFNFITPQNVFVQYECWCGAFVNDICSFKNKTKNLDIGDSTTQRIGRGCSFCGRFQVSIILGNKKHACIGSFKGHIRFQLLVNPAKHIYVMLYGVRKL